MRYSGSEVKYGQCWVFAGVVATGKGTGDAIACPFPLPFGLKLLALSFTSVKKVLEQYRHADLDCFLAHLYRNIILSHSHDATNAFIKSS
jgi:hypothetical protein